MRIRVEVVKDRGLPHAVVVEAASARAASDQLKGQGYSVLAASAAGFGLQLVPRWGSAPEKRIDVAVFVEQLRDLLVAGLSVIEALETLHRGASGEAGVISAMIRRLRNGETLSQALAGDRQFPTLLASLVQTAEITSDLPQALTRFLEHQRRVDEIRHSIISVSIYPALLIAVGSGVLLFLLFYVVPRFARVFEGMGGDLPWSARAMITWAHWLGANAFGVGAALCGVVILVIGLASSQSARGAVLRQVMAWEPLHRRVSTYFLARWYRATGMLAAGGISLPEALTVSNDLLPAGLRAGGDAVVRALREGSAPADAHAREGMATPVAEQLMRAGERTGDFGNVLMRIAAFHEAEIARSIERTMRAIEPIVMVAIGVGVGGIVVLMYMPIFELSAAIQ